MTFIYELDPCTVEIHRMCKYKLPLSRFSKIIIQQTDKIDQNYKPRHFASGQQATNLIFVVLNVKHMVCEEQNFVSMRDEVSLFQPTNKTTHRNVIYTQTTVLEKIQRIQTSLKNDHAC